MVALELLGGGVALRDPASAQTVFAGRSSAPVAIPLSTMSLGFITGSVVLTARMIRGIPTARWSAASMLVGVLLIAMEIASGVVLLSQVGNVLVWIGAVGCAIRLRRIELDVRPG